MLKLLTDPCFLLRISLQLPKVLQAAIQFFHILKGIFQVLLQKPKVLLQQLRLDNGRTLCRTSNRLEVRHSLDTVSDFKLTSIQTMIGHCVRLQVGQSLDTVPDFKSTSSQTIVGHCVGLQVDFKSDNRRTLCRTSSRLQVRQSLNTVYRTWGRTIVEHCVGL